MRFPFFILVLIVFSSCFKKNKIETIDISGVVRSEKTGEGTYAITAILESVKTVSSGEQYVEGGYRPKVIVASDTITAYYDFY